MSQCFILINKFLYLSVDFKKLFDKQAFMNQIKEQGKALVKTAASELAKEFLSTLGLPEVIHQFENVFPFIDVDIVLFKLQVSYI